MSFSFHTRKTKHLPKHFTKSAQTVVFIQRTAFELPWIRQGRKMPLELFTTIHGSGKVHVQELLTLLSKQIMVLDLYSWVHEGCFFILGESNMCTRNQKTLILSLSPGERESITAAKLCETPTNCPTIFGTAANLSIVSRWLFSTSADNDKRRW